MKSIPSTLALFTALFFTFSAAAQVTVGEPWIRSTVPHQMSTGAFMELKSATDAKLLEVRSTVAGVVEIHEMRMENNVMRMRAVPSVVLPAGRTVELKPGGYHVMMMDLKQQMKEGEVVPITLVVECGGKRETIDVMAKVRAATSSGDMMKKHAN